jgi:hypothetical protein
MVHTLSKGTGRDGGRKGSGVDDHRLGGRIDPVAGAPQAETSLEIELIGAWLFTEMNLKLGTKRATLGGGAMARSIGFNPTGIVATTLLSAVSITATWLVPTLVT